MKTPSQFKRQAEQAAEKQRKIQSDLEENGKKRVPKEKEKPMQAGARKYPEPPVAKQHLKKPGSVL